MSRPSDSPQTCHLTLNCRFAGRDACVCVCVCMGGWVVISLNGYWEGVLELLLPHRD